MIKWFKKKQDNLDEAGLAASTLKEDEPLFNEALKEEPLSGETIKKGFFSRFKKGLSKTGEHFNQGIARLLLGKKELDAALLEELEALLLSADLGVETTERVLQDLSAGLKRKDLTENDAVLQALKKQLQELLVANEKPFNLETHDKSPFVILTIGVNGAGKTTSIGKLAKQFQQQGKKVMLAAGDTFRAAAVEQLQIWGARNNIPVIAQQTGSDSASVVYDALQAAKARGIDILIADTAGRLHTQNNLMEELKKVKRVIQKVDPRAPHETLLVLDASIGQNALIQARQFHEAIDLTGIIMTKLDGTAKGGILFAIAHELGIPFRYLGIGEGIDDLRSFDASQFVKAIFNDDQL